MIKSSVGRKMVMAVTGAGMIFFILVHLLGNLTLYSGPAAINAYAYALHRFGPLIWSFRLVMFCMFMLHLFFGIQLTLENRAARPQSYAVRNERATTFAGKSMVWSGLLIGAFLLFHLLQFTLQVINPGIAAASHPDPIGRPDVFTMVVLSFQRLSYALLYIVSLTALALHLYHSIQSSFQTLGLNGERTFPVVTVTGRVAAIMIFLGYAAFPIVIYMGFLR